MDKALVARINGVVENVERVIFGKHHEIELALVALICRGHILVEDVPGGGLRYRRDATGFRATIVNGVVTQENGMLTGKLPGHPLPM